MMVVMLRHNHRCQRRGQLVRLELPVRPDGTLDGRYGATCAETLTDLTLVDHVHKLMGPEYLDRRSGGLVDPTVSYIGSAAGVPASSIYGQAPRVRRGGLNFGSVGAVFTGAPSPIVGTALHPVRAGDLVDIVLQPDGRATVAPKQSGGEQLGLFEHGELLPRRVSLYDLDGRKRTISLMGLDAHERSAFVKLVRLQRERYVAGKAKREAVHTESVTTQESQPTVITGDAARVSPEDAKALRDANEVLGGPVRTQPVGYVPPFGSAPAPGDEGPQPEGTPPPAIDQVLVNSTRDRLAEIMESEPPFDCTLIVAALRTHAGYSASQARLRRITGMEHRDIGHHIGMLGRYDVVRVVDYTRLDGYTFRLNTPVWEKG